MLRLRPTVAWREADGEIVLLDLEGGVYMTVNATGAALWPLLVGGTTADTLEAAIIDRFDVDPERAQQDVAAFIAWLRDRSLVDG